MNPLFKNDRQGEYAPSWYTASADIPPARPSLDGDVRTDVCVIGAGFTGLCAALFLSERGFKVHVIEAHRAGSGASGRNGGQVLAGYREEQSSLERQLGETRARALWDMSLEAVNQVKTLSAKYAPRANFRPGVAHGDYTDAERRATHAEAEFLAKRYGYDKIETYGPDEFRNLVKSPLYQGGLLDRGSGHIHPLRYALGLADAAEAAGAVICEKTVVTDLKKGQPARVVTDKGTVTADWVVLAGNGYMPLLERNVASHVMPINSFIAATEPLGNRAMEVLAEDIAVGDSRFVVNYYRFSEDQRFLFGGREAYTLGFPKDIGAPLQKRMATLFPQIGDVKIDFTWGGTLGITMTRMPYVRRIAPNILNASGFSGHGVALSGFSGRLMAEAIAGQAERFDTLSVLPTRAFPGGASLRMPLLTLGMTWYALRDRLGI